MAGTNTSQDTQRRCWAEPAFWLLIVLHVATRCLFLWIKPAHIMSADVGEWWKVVEALRHGQNPYITTQVLVHPPFGMQLVYLIDRVSVWLDITFPAAFWLVLNVFEPLVVIACYVLVRNWIAPRRAFWIVWVGISLQPALMFQTCQHGNIDLFVGLFVTLAVGGFVAYARTKDLTRWLAGCFWLGLGILVKAVPLILLPLLLIAAGAGFGNLLLGAAITMMPLAVGMSIIFALAPGRVINHVMEYRSFPGYFGISGLLWQWNWATRSGIEVAIRRAFPKFVMLLMLAAMIPIQRIRRALPNDGRVIVLLGMLLLLVVPTLGPGYSSQYVYWWFPLMVVTAGIFGRGWLIVCAIVWGVTAVTNCAEYSLLPSHGAMLLRWDEQTWRRWSGFSEDLSALKWQTWLRFPMFVVNLLALAVGVATLRREARNLQPAA